MKKFLVLGITALMAAGAGIALSKSVNTVKEDLDARIIVQLDSPLARKSSKRLLAEQSSIISSIHQEVTPFYEIGSRYTNVLNAFSMKVNASHVSQIRNLPGVKNIVYDTYREVSNSAEGLIAARNATIPTAPVDNISAETMNIPEDNNEGEGTLIAILDSSFMIHANSPEKDPLIPGVEDLSHTAFTALDGGVNAKYTEQSIKDVIDEAGESFHGKYDETHSTYFNSKVPFYYDYGGDIEVEDPYDENNPEAVPDFDVYTEGSDHGNHVASIAAGNDPYYKGIAPKAQLALMKVFTATTYYADTTDDDGKVVKKKVISVGAYDKCILDALEDVAILKADVFNMSLGSALNEFTQDSFANEAIANLEAKGIVGSISAGNEGKETWFSSAYEYWTTDMVETGILGSYALNDSGMIISSSHPTKRHFDTALIVGKNVIAFKDQVQNSSSQTFTKERKLTDLKEDYPDGKFDWVKIPGWGESKDYAEFGLATDKPLAGKIAVIDRGEINFSVKVRNAANYGAIAAAIIDNDPTATDFNFTMLMSGYNPPIPVVSFLYRDRGIFGDAPASGKCQLVEDETLNDPKGNTLSDFTSDGPTYDLRIKADISTPGNDIYGAVYDETSNNSYDYYSGTSMAAPNFSGAYAVILSEDLANPAWRASLNERLMTAATPMFDKFGEDEETGGNLESVRKQGAGLINVDAAIKTKVLLDGSSDPEHLTNRTKIELKNNDDIKEGKIRLNFTSISSAASDITYTASLHVYRPGTGTLDEEHFGEKFKDVTLMACTDELIKITTSQMVVTPGTQTHSLSYDLDTKTKQTLDGLFENGCYIEGFVILEAEGEETISIPYLGFYGDYDKGEPVEPFKFERDEDKVYQSDLLNSLGAKWVQKSGCDFASDWIMGNWKDLKDLSLEEYLYNNIFFRDIVDGNKNKVIPVGTNPYTGKIETNDIYMGNNGYTNTMIIAQFVLRTVEDNTITITNKANNKVVLTDHMFDSLFGALEDDDGNDYQWPLYKSHMNPDYFSNGLMAHRAYTIIPLYEYEYDEKNEKYINGEPFADGEYEIKFSYQLHAGGTFEKTYTLHIDSKGPAIKNIEKVNNGEDLRVRFDEEKFSYLSVNAYKRTISTDDLGYYTDLKISDYTEGDKVFIKAYDFAYGLSGTLLHMSDEKFTTVSSHLLTNAFDFTHTFVNEGGRAFTTSFAFTKGGKATTVAGNIDVTMNIGKYLYEGAETKVYIVNADGSKTEIWFDISGETLQFSGASNATFYIDFDINKVAPDLEPDPGPEPGPGPVDPEPEPEPEKKSSGCGGSIIAGSTVISLVSALGFTLMMFKKRKHD